MTARGAEGEGALAVLKGEGVLLTPTVLADHGRVGARQGVQRRSLAQRQGVLAVLAVLLVVVLIASFAYPTSAALDNARGVLFQAPFLAVVALGMTLVIITGGIDLSVGSVFALDGTLTDTAGHPLCRHGAVCLETQHLPDAPNRPAYPSPVLRPGTTSHRRTEFRFPHPTTPHAD